MTCIILIIVYLDHVYTYHKAGAHRYTDLTRVSQRHVPAVIQKHA